MNKTNQYLLIAAVTVVALYTVSQSSNSTVASGVSTGAEFVGAGIGLVIVGGGILVAAKFLL
jgi:hypothetical protein